MSKIPFLTVPHLGSFMSYFGHSLFIRFSRHFMNIRFIFFFIHFVTYNKHDRLTCAQYKQNRLADARYYSTYIYISLVVEYELVVVISTVLVNFRGDYQSLLDGKYCTYTHTDPSYLQYRTRTRREKRSLLSTSSASSGTRGQWAVGIENSTTTAFVLATRENKKKHHFDHDATCGPVQWNNGMIVTCMKWFLVLNH